jgi:hypothetical protein
MAGSIMLQEALELHQAGFCVIPLLERSKKPALVSWKQYQRRRPGLVELHGWFAYGNRNLAVVCGPVSAPRGLSLAVLDFDRPGFEAWAEEHSEIVDSTWISATGRAGGRHVWLLVPSGAASAQFGCGEIKAEGGYIVAPPSLHPCGRRYRWLQHSGRIAAAGDLSILGVKVARLSTGSPIQARGPEGWCAPPQDRRKAEASVNGMCERLLAIALQRVAYGRRNATGFWLAAQLRDNGCGQASATNVMLRYQVTVAEMGDHGYTVGEALRTLDSAYSRPARQPWAGLWSR